jgi:hypothetical protein
VEQPDLYASLERGGVAASSAAARRYENGCFVQCYVNIKIK